MPIGMTLIAYATPFAISKLDVPDPAADVWSPSLQYWTIVLCVIMCYSQLFPWYLLTMFCSIRLICELMWTMAADTKMVSFATQLIWDWKLFLGNNCQEIFILDTGSYTTVFRGERQKQFDEAPSNYKRDGGMFDWSQKPCTNTACCPQAIWRHLMANTSDATCSIVWILPVTCWFTRFSFLNVSQLARVSPPFAIIVLMLQFTEGLSCVHFNQTIQHVVCFFLIPWSILRCDKGWYSADIALIFITSLLNI